MTTSIEDRIAAAQQPDFDPNTVDFDVWGVNGGGLATRDDDRQCYVWIQLPKWVVNLSEDEQSEFVLGKPTGMEGDMAPDVIPANKAAQDDMDRECCGGDWVLSTVDRSWGEF